MFLNENFLNILSMSLAATFSFLLILFARKLLNKKVKVSMKSLLWIIFILTLLIPINFSSKLSIKNYISDEMNFVKVQLNELEIINDSFDESKAVLIGEKLELNKNISVLFIVSNIWLIGTLFLVLKDAYFYFKVSKFEMCEASEDINKLFYALKEKLNISNDIKLMIQDKIKTPSLYGITNVFILLPSSVINLNRDELEMIIYHELMHYKRRHNLVFVFLKLLEDIHWFNPFIKLANSLIREDLECLVDVDVLNQNYNRNSYSKTILKVVECANYGKEINLIPGMYNNKKALERRFLNMKNEKGNVKYAIVITATLLALISILTVSFASEKIDEIDFVEEQIYEEDVSNNQEELCIVMPLDEIKVTSTFGTRIHPITKETKTHNGVDLKASEGTEVYAIMDGTVLSTNYESERGNTICVKHENDYVSTYAHGLEFLVEPGDSVKAGTSIMKVGATGTATGPHLHLELENEKGELVDINKFFE